MKKGLKLIIVDHAEPSVGLLESRYEIDCPFDSDAGVEDRKLFAIEAISAFVEFAQGKLTYYYNDEKEQQHEDI